ncbi:hypothetical protein D3C75_1098480 [compost metagenome]
MALLAIVARRCGAIRASLTMIGYSAASTRPNSAMLANDQRQPSFTAIAPPMEMPSTEPNMAPAMKALARVARMLLGKTDTTTATPTLP